MPVVHSRYELLINEVRRMIEKDGADANKRPGKNIHLFNNRIAHGNYETILKDSSKSAFEKLLAIYLLALTLMMKHKFNESTKLHQKIADLTECVSEEARNKYKR